MDDRLIHLIQQYFAVAWAQIAALWSRFPLRGQDIASATWAGTADIADVAGTEAAGSAVTIPRGDHTHTIGSGVVTSAMIADGTIVNADISSSAAIDPGKFAPQAFFVYLNTSTSNDKTGDGTQYNLVTDSEKIDVGNNVSSGTFTVPGSGTQYWMFSASVAFANVGAGHTAGQVGLLHSGDGLYYLSDQVSLASIRTNGNIATVKVMGVPIVVSGGATVKVACFAYNSTKTVGVLGNANPLTWFAGYKIG